jgi:predicted HAD superfamily hydrolase
VYRTHPYDDQAKYLAGLSFGLNELEAERFVGLRNQCELRLRQETGEGDVGLSDVSNSLSSKIEEILGLSISPSELHSREVSMETRILRPKTRICRIISNRQSAGKETIIASDTYYQTKDFQKLLESVGISPRGLDIRLSSETGIRKDRGDYWKREASRFSKDPNFLHVGDNYVSDVQIPGDYGLANLLILNSRDLAKLHGVDIGNSLESMNNLEHVHAHRLFQNQERPYIPRHFGGDRLIRV